MAESSGNEGKRVGGGAESGAWAATELAAVIEAWPSLPAAIKAGILAMVQLGH